MRGRFPNETDAGDCEEEKAACERDHADGSCAFATGDGQETVRGETSGRHGIMQPADAVESIIEGQRPTSAAASLLVVHRVISKPSDCAPRQTDGQQAGEKATVV